MSNLPVILLVGPSGSGKTTIAELLSSRNGWKQIESYTTRAPRYEGEIDHIFITDKEFDRLTDIVAYTEYNGHRYGCTATQIDSCQIYVVDIPGVETLLKNYKGNKKFLAVIPALSETTRWCRMLERGDTKEKIEERIAIDRDAFADVECHLALLLGGENVFIARHNTSTENAIAIEDYLSKKGYTAAKTAAMADLLN